MKNLAAVVLAAGLSSRFGARDKLLHPYRGRLLLEWTLRAVAAAGLVDCVVVIGPQEAEKAALVAAHGLRAIENPTPELGMAVSLGCGVRGVRGKIDGICICGYIGVFISSYEPYSTCHSAMVYTIFPTWYIKIIPYEIYYFF